MTIYLDLILLLNFFLDLLLLITTSYILRRGASINRLLIGAFIGSLSTLLLFIKINSLELFILKIIISIFMCLATFNYKNIKYTLKNIAYLYLSSSVLGGVIYLLNIQFSYKNEGIVFYHNGLSINFYFLVISSPIIIYIYIRQCISLKNNYNHYYKVKVYIQDKIIELNGYLDTGNKLKDPYSNKTVILVENNDIYNNYPYVLIPIDTVNNHDLIKCIKPDKVEVVGVGCKYNVMLGLLNKKINIDGINCILNERIIEKI